MFHDRLEGDRFFARLSKLDMECPQCGEVYHLGNKGGPFNKRISEFTCPSCGLVLAIGVIAYPVTRAGQKQTPADCKPNYRQALALRSLYPGLLCNQQKGWTDPHNVVMREGCKCSVVRRGLIVHPGCPIHGGELAK